MFDKTRDKMFLAKIIAIIAVIFDNLSIIIGETSCSNPVSWITSNFETFEWDFNPSSTILYDGSIAYSFTPPVVKTSLLLSTIKVSNWSSSIDFVYAERYFQEFPLCILMPQDQMTANYILEYIAEKEAKLRPERIILPRIFIVWPEPLHVVGNDLNLAEIIDVASTSNDSKSGILPSIASEIYLLLCDDRAENSWNILTVHSVGREGVTTVRARSWDNIFNHFHYNWNFQQGTLNAVFRDVEQEDFSYKIKNGSITDPSGFIGNIANYVRDGLNLTVNYTIAKGWDNQTGIATHLLEGRADVITEKITYLPARRRQLQAVTPIYAQGIQAFLRQPPASSFRNILTQPFTKDLWVVLAVVWILVSVSSFTAAKVKSYFHQLEWNDEQVSKDTILWAIGFTCQQGWHLDPESVSMKIIFFVGTLLGLLVYVAYSAALVSALSTIVVPIKTFSDLLESNLAITYDPGSSAIEHILNETSVGQLLRKRTRKVKTVKAGVRHVFASSTCMLCWPDLFYSLTKNTFFHDDAYICSTITALRVNQVPFKSGFMLPKGSPYAEFFSVKLLTILENGLLYRYLRHYFLSLRVLGAGYLLSLTLLIIEKIYSFYDTSWKLAMWVHLYELHLKLDVWLGKVRNE